MGYISLLILRNRRLLRKCCHALKFACGCCLWINFLLYLYIITMFIMRLQTHTKKKEDGEVDIDAFLERYRNNVSFKERHLLVNWNDSDIEIPFNNIGCKFIIGERSKHHHTSLMSRTKCPNSYIVIILTTSDIYDFNRRMLIRNTWGSDRNMKTHRWKTYFLVGLTHRNETLHVLSCENEMFNDIIYGNVYEHFNNLTSKVQMGFEWALMYCEFKYLLKTDTDVFVNVPRLLHFLYHKDTQRVKLYAGHVQFSAPVLRKGKYAVSKKQYWKKVYPRYCSGGGFVLSLDVVERMTSHFDDVKRLKISDAYVGELALKSGVDAFHDDRFRMFVDEKKCLFDEKVIVYHPVRTKKCMLYLFVKHLGFVNYVDKIITSSQMALGAKYGLLPGVMMKKHRI